MRIRFLLSVFILSLFVTFLLNCEAPTKPERDAPEDEKAGEHYQIPETPVVYGPADNIGFGETYSIQWNEVERAKRYAIEESESPDSLFTVAIADTIDGTSKEFSHLVSTQTTYFYRVKGINGEYESDWSNKVDVIVNPLDIPDITSKEQTIISGNEYNIVWAPVDSAQSYILQESTTDSFNNPIEKTTSGASFTTTHTTESPSMFYYRVQARHSDFTSGWSDVAAITINPPYPVTPSIKSPVVHWNSVTLTWNDVSYATSYTIEAADNSDFTRSVVSDVENTTSTTIPFDIDEETTMYYRIKAHGISGSSSWSNTVELEIVPQPPLAPVITCPDSVKSGDNYTISWNDVEAISFIIEESTDESFNEKRSWELSDLFKEFIYSVDEDTKYYYRVLASSKAGNSDWSNTISIEIFGSAGIIIIDIPWPE